MERDMPIYTVIDDDSGKTFNIDADTPEDAAEEAASRIDESNEYVEPGEDRFVEVKGHGGFRVACVQTIEYKATPEP